MKKSSFDIKSACIGFLGAALIMSVFGFNNPTDELPGRYQATAGEEGIVIIDTQTGQYIIDDRASFSGKTVWTKGSFADTYEKGENRAIRKRSGGN